MVVLKRCFCWSICRNSKNAVIDEGTRIQSHSFICSEVNIGKNCFIGHGVMFINDTFSDGSINFSDHLKKQLLKTM